MACTPMRDVFVVCLMSFHWEVSHEEPYFGTWPWKKGRGGVGAWERSHPLDFGSSRENADLITGRLLISR